MEVVQPYAEKYLMKLTFYAEDDPAFNLVFLKETYTVTVRLTNTAEKPLTQQNLQCVALSIPYLHYRLTGLPYAPGLLPLAHLQTDPLPLDYSVSIRPTPTLDPRRQTLDRVSLEHSTIPLTKMSLPEDQLHGSQGDSGSSRITDWFLCDGSFVPDFPGKEWTSVNYGGLEFIRAFSPIRQTDDAADILGRCNITDYTAYEQFVFSIDVDILKAKGPSGREEASPASKRKEGNSFVREVTSLDDKWDKGNSLEREEASPASKREEGNSFVREVTSLDDKWDKGNSLEREDATSAYTWEEMNNLDREDTSSTYKEEEGNRFGRKAGSSPYKRKERTKYRDSKSKAC
ncbi:unnamed protein product [Coregonus sp. 'balchen']|nr:unnamed protein product [Coregonus sp. 'balchen']